jgi:hypothetical protein
MKLNARILHLAHMVYLFPKHNLLLAQYIPVYGGACFQPLSDIPFLLLGNPSLTSWKTIPYLLGNPSFVSWREFPSTLVPGWLYTDPPPTPPFPFSPSQRFPLLNACPLRTTLQHRLP